MTIDMSQFYQVFFEETAEHLGSMESLLLGLDLDRPDAEQLNAIFRAAHSIKGSAGTFGFTDLASFQQVANLVTDIANASREQSSGIEQVTQAVGQMDEVTQQNAALVEQAAAAAESLEEQARGLVKAVGMFKLSEGGAGGGHAAPMRRLAAAAGSMHGRAQPKKISLPAATGEEEWEEF